MHPRTSTLVAYCDAEFDPARSGRIAAHVQGCARCRAELQRIEAERDCLSAWQSGIRPPVDAKRGLAAVLAAVARWQETAPPELNGLLRSRLEFYFGPGATAIAERPDIPAGELLAKTIELLAAFLGRDAAEAVVHDVLQGLGCAALTAEVSP
jgi:anti-sigma factor RsiW